MRLRCLLLRFKKRCRACEPVDLGLSVKWATCNVGATRPSEYGDYFAWGETRPKRSFYDANLKYCLDKRGDLFPRGFSKYVADAEFGKPDNRTRLELRDDAANANWGGKWRMPTAEELKELKEQCDWRWTYWGYNEGYEVTSKINGNSIFLPAGGYRIGTDIKYVGAEGAFWSSTLYEEFSDYAFFLSFNGDDVDLDFFGRSIGRSVRPVTE